jgi:hypothetical protein
MYPPRKRLADRDEAREASDQAVPNLALVAMISPPVRGLQHMIR